MSGSAASGLAAGEGEELGVEAPLSVGEEGEGFPDHHDERGYYYRKS
jgi:hypothetical protein